MKKHLKKLSLHRETLRSLQGGEMGQVAGGSDTSLACVEVTGCCAGSQGETDCYRRTQCLWGCSLSAETCRC
jgi:hypothetical protein